MVVEVQISKRSQELINSYLEALGSHQSPLQKEDVSIELDLLVSWLKAEITLPYKKPKKLKYEIEFLLAKLRVELLHDLSNFMPTSRKSRVKKEEDLVLASNKFKFILLAISGTILAACEGFDSVTTMMSVLSLPSWAILAVGLVFSILSVVVFYGFNLIQVSKNLGINLMDTPKLLDVYLAQLEEIKSIRRKMSAYNLAEKSTEELAQLYDTLIMLNNRFSELIKNSEQFKLALDTNSMRVAKTIFSGLAGLLFFGGGFFAGQSVGIFIFGLFITAATPTAWPVVIFSLLVGAAGFSIYWFIERVSLKKLISGWFGLDEDKIEQLCDSDKLLNEEEKLLNLKDNVVKTFELTQKASRLTHIDNYAPPMNIGEKSTHNQRKPIQNGPINTLYSFFIAPSVTSNYLHDMSEDAGIDYQNLNGLNHN